MSVYSIEVKVCATVYVKADSEAEAMAKLKAQGPAQDCWGGWGVDASTDVSGAPFDSPDLPEMSFSPMMTCYGPWDNETEVELVED